MDTIWKPFLFSYVLGMVSGVVATAVYFSTIESLDEQAEHAPAPATSAEVERLAWHTRRREVMQWCEREEKGTVTMGFGFEIICIGPHVATITYDQSNERWTREGRETIDEPAELRDGGAR